MNSNETLCQRLVCLPVSCPCFCMCVCLCISCCPSACRFVCLPACLSVCQFESTTSVKDRDLSFISPLSRHGHCNEHPPPDPLQGQTFPKSPSWNHQSPLVFFFGARVRMGGRSRSAIPLSPSISLSLRALICGCQCPLTDVFLCGGVWQPCRTDAT